MTRAQPVASTDVSHGAVGPWPDRRAGDRGQAAMGDSPTRDFSMHDSSKRDSWKHAYRSVRAETERRAAGLSAEDQVVQSMPDASPIKWHRAHTTWFFEQFVLAPRLADYRSFDERFAYLFNSYYVAAGARHARPKRGLVTRPDCDEVVRYRAHVDGAIQSSPPVVVRRRTRRRDRIARNRAQSRAAAPGIDVDRHPSRVLGKSDRAGLRSFVPVAAARRRPGRLLRAARGHPHHRASDRRFLLRQRDPRAPHTGRPGAPVARPRAQRRMARLHARWRLCAARAVAVGRLGHGLRRRLDRARPLARDRRRLDELYPGRVARGRGRHAGVPCQLL